MDIKSTQEPINDLPQNLHPCYRPNCNGKLIIKQLSIYDHLDNP